MKSAIYTSKAWPNSLIARFSGRITLGFILVCLFLVAVIPAKAASGPALLALVIDDYKNIDLWARLANDCERFGFRTTLALDTRRVTPEDWSRLEELAKKGHEIASHTKGHVPLSMDQVLLVRYYKPGAVSATARLNSEVGRLQIFLNGERSPILDLDLSAGGAQPTVKSLAEVIGKQPDFSAKLADPYYANIQSRFLAPVEEVDILFSSDFAPFFINSELHVRSELTESKVAIESNIPGYKVRSIVYPFLAHDHTTRRVAEELGYIGGRTGPAGNRFLDSPEGYDLFSIWAAKPKDLFGPAESQAFAGRVKSFVEEFKSKSGAGCLYSHGSNEFSNEEWRILLELLSTEDGIRIVTIGGLIAEVKREACVDDSGRYRVCPEQ